MDSYALLSRLITKVKTSRPENDTDLITKAFAFAESAHENQKRRSGEPYIIHPVESAVILSDLKMDTATIAAALLHDVVEDTKFSIEDIKTEFGQEIADLVDGVTKISSLNEKTKQRDQAETLRKMLMATIKDARVIIIKLADRTHNMRTISAMPRAKQERIAQEVFDIYAPLAGRLGISQMRSELEDLAFEVIYPEEYNELKTKISERREEMEAYIEYIQSELSSAIHKSGMSANITGRVKHYYSIYKKLKAQNKSLDDIYDIRAVRVLTDEVKSCYAILGIVHTLWSPIPARFKDYIAVPKSNLYQSLHTTVTGPDNHFLEIQIRTFEMDRTAEIGIAAHWAYKEKVNAANENVKYVSLLQDIKKWRDEIKNTREFMTELKMDLYKEEIFAFTPNGKIIKLPFGATPVDFAYSIHSEVGNHCSGARINNKLVPLKTEIQNGDIVEIITTANKGPTESWLKFVKSSGARNKIKSWLNHKKKLLLPDSQEEKKEKTQKQTRVSVPQNELIKISKLSSKNKSSVIVDGNSNVLISLAQCCQPIPGDEVIGFITRGKGISVHKKNCASIKRLAHSSERFIKIVWAESAGSHPVKIAVEAEDRPNLLKDITDKIYQMNVNIVKMEGEATKSGNAEMRFVIEVKSIEELNAILKKIRETKNVLKAFKVNEKVVIKQ
ncbi:MAG TPA: bifunctional (p)ppGpp synthetase/guanosine-3',5'-bis(diphosphate) 3'-pyrophosphohydrolase [Spirochaetota bacterium]|nr:bifunctional (p)ppGpp synthetase/guanosine-3',5'-bis(diphosphate) 3'-pyrophosphohydrolase [Spirochaetota bacterium]